MQEQNYIDGQWVPSTTSNTIEILNPATEATIGAVPDSNAADVDAAVAAAAAAFGRWSAASGEDRASHLARIHTLMAEREEDFVNALIADVGVPRKMAQRLQFGLPLNVLATYTKADVLPGDETVGNSQIVREPIGVVGAVTPWNYPLHQTIAKVAPALLAGCTIVLKPSEVTPMAVELLTEVIDAAGLPAGVFNLVHGGVAAGAALVAHPDVDMVSFTGSTRAGKEVGRAAAEGIKRVSLELGGKSPNIVLPDVPDLPKVLKNAVGNCFLNSGQTCLALTRLLVHQSQYDEAVQIVGDIAGTFTVGDPDDLATKLGPLTSAAHRDRVLGFIRTGIDEGARLVQGGADTPEGLDHGYFVRPTVFADVTPEMTIAREEIFGPVLSVMSYSTDDEAVEIANGTDYGLCSAVWSADQDRAIGIARRLRAGQVDVNGGAFNPRAPFGGYKKSGNGRELGALGLHEFLETKSIQL